VRYPEGHKAAVRAVIVQHAAQLLRRDGLSGVSIPALMKAAGLTHGGFYAHFASREEVVAAAVHAAAAETNGGAMSADDGALDVMLARYLSKGHVDHRSGGCVLAALGSEGARQPEPVRGAFAHAARGFLRRVEDRRAPGGPAGALSDEGLRLAAQMLGAVVLARLVDDDALAERILGAARAPR
jgi:TetR/AcrR family transcriptional repressor of nem operon